MKILFRLILLLFTASAWAQNAYVFRPNVTAEQIQLYRKLDVVWPAEGQAVADAFEDVRRLMLADAESSKLLSKVNGILQAHGISDVKDIVGFCESSSSGAPQSLGKAFFQFKVQVLAFRPRFTGLDEVAWSQEVQSQMKSAYEWKVFKTHFMDLLMITTQTPRVCINQGETLRSVYDLLVHELTHFSERDLFHDLEADLQHQSFDRYLEEQLMEKGGEYEAFKAGISAEVRLLNKMGIENSNLQYPFFSPQGELKDPAGFKNMLLESYRPYYTHSATLVGLAKDRASLTAWRVDMLQQYVRPLVKKKNEALLPAIDQEISRLKSLSY